MEMVKTKFIRILFHVSKYISKSRLRAWLLIINYWVKCHYVPVASIDSIHPIFKLHDQKIRLPCGFSYEFSHLFKFIQTKKVIREWLLDIIRIRKILFLNLYKFSLIISEGNQPII